MVPSEISIMAVFHFLPLLNVNKFHASESQVPGKRRVNFETSIVALCSDKIRFSDDTFPIHGAKCVCDFTYYLVLNASFLSQMNSAIKYIRARA